MEQIINLFREKMRKSGSSGGFTGVMTLYGMKKAGDKARNGFVDADIRKGGKPG